MSTPEGDSESRPSWKNELRYLGDDIHANPSVFIRSLLVSYRFTRALHASNAPSSVKRLSAFLYSVIFNLLVIPLGGGELPFRTTLGPGVKFPHRLGGTVLHPAAQIGKGTQIYHQVTIGRSTYFPDGRPKVPVIGAEVAIYPGAKIIGDILIGDYAIIGANALVVENVPHKGRAFCPKAVVKEERA
jgi:serine acetyltransferase